MHLHTELTIEYLWGETKIEKDSWGDITYLIGPNGTGKSLYAEKLRSIFTTNGIKTRYLNAERLAGLERQAYSYFTNNSPIDKGLNLKQFKEYKTYGANFGLAADSWIILKEKPDVRIKVEALISQLFNRTIRLSEEGGFLSPKIQLKGSKDEYGFREGESHGLKEIISLLTFIYDDEFNCLILDEPELHLHPQYQQFLLSEIKKNAGDPRLDSSKKLFMIITHSPFFVDLQKLEDLKNIIVFHQGKKPKWIDEIDDENDVYRINKILPRINTHHKQFFFATKPIFVEGYTDQILMNYLQEIRGQKLGAKGFSIIDVGGKNDVDAFFRLCKKLHLEPSAIVDYDAIFDGKLKQTINEDPIVNEYIQNQGTGTTLNDLISSMINILNEITEEFSVQEIRDNHPLTNLYQSISQQARIENKRRLLFVGIMREHEELVACIPSKRGQVLAVIGMAEKIISAFKEGNVFVLPKGELENYLPSYNGNPYIINDSAKATILEEERLYLSLNTNISDVESRYSELISILDEVCESEKFDLIPYLKATIGNLVHLIQTAFNSGEIQGVESIKTNQMIQWKNFERLLSGLEFESVDEQNFTCNLTISDKVSPENLVVQFTNETVPAKTVIHTR